MATPLAIVAAGGPPVFVDCNSDDLCASLRDFEAERAGTGPRPPSSCTSAATSPSRCGRSRRCAPPRASSCSRTARTRTAPSGTAAARDVGRRRRLLLLRDQDGLDRRGRHPGLESDDVLEFARAYRNYGKPDHEVAGLNFRMSEFTAALGLVQTERMENRRVEERRGARAPRPVHPGRLALPDGMISGLYKYIVFDPIERSSGKVYDQPCHRIMGTGDELPNSDWVAEGHWCVPLYYRPEADGATHEGPRHRRGRLHRLARRRQAARRGHEPRIFDVRPSGTTIREVDTVIGDMRVRDACCGGEGLRRDRAPRRRRRRRRGRAAPRRAEQLNARGTLNVLEAARARESRASSTPRRSGSTAAPTGTVDEEHTARAARAPLHRDQARGRDVLPLLPRALRRGLDRAALRDPLRPARAAGGA